MKDLIHYEKTGAVARITLDDGKVNAMNLPWFEALHAALDRAEADGAGAVVIAGREGCFSGGLDLKVLPTLSPEELGEFSRVFARTMLRVFALPIPTVAAITGNAVAGGVVLASACDTRIATSGDFKIQLNEVAVGIPLPTFAAQIVSSAWPSHLLNQAVLHSRVFTPDEAREAGFVANLGASPDDTLGLAEAAALPLTLLNRDAYAESKKRLRAPAIDRALATLEAETKPA